MWLTLMDKKVRVDLAYPLSEIEKMIEIAPEIISTFEPGENGRNCKGKIGICGQNSSAAAGVERH
jgi:hypothetical protein